MSQPSATSAELGTIPSATDSARALLDGVAATRTTQEAVNVLARHGVDATTTRPAWRFRVGASRQAIRDAQDTLSDRHLGARKIAADNAASHVDLALRQAADRSWRETAPMRDILQHMRLLGDPGLQRAYASWTRRPFPAAAADTLGRALKERAPRHRTSTHSPFRTTTPTLMNLDQLQRAHDAAVARDFAGRPSRDLLRDFHLLSTPSADHHTLPVTSWARGSLGGELARRSGLRGATWADLERAVIARTGGNTADNASHLIALLDRLDANEVRQNQFVALAVAQHPAAQATDHTLGWVGTYGQIVAAAYDTFGNSSFGGLGGDMYEIDPEETHTIYGQREDDFDVLLDVKRYSIAGRELDPGEKPNAGEVQQWFAHVTPAHLDPGRINVARDEHGEFSVTIKGTEQEVNLWATHLSETAGPIRPWQVTCDGRVGTYHDAPLSDVSPPLDEPSIAATRAR